MAIGASAAGVEALSQLIRALVEEATGRAAIIRRALLRPDPVRDSQELPAE